MHLESENNQADNSADRKDRPTKLWPALINVISSYRARANAEKEERDLRDIAAVKWAKVTAYGTWAAVIVAGGAAVVVVLQLNAMQTANEFANASFIQGNRAYVFPKPALTNIWIKETGLLDRVDIVIRFVNTGDTPAFKANCSADISESRKGLGKPDKPPNAALDLGPEQSLDCPTLRVTRSQIIDILNGKKPLYYWARVEYLDAFDKTPRRHTAMCGPLLMANNPIIPGADPNAATFRLEPFEECTSAS